MSSFSKSDTPAAKVVMKVPTPDSLVEVMVSPPDSKFEVKVTPGEEIIELHIRAGSNSFVEVRICPPAEGKGQKDAATTQISLAGDTVLPQPAPKAEPVESAEKKPAAAVQPAAHPASTATSFASGLLDAADSALGAKLDNLDTEIPAVFHQVEGQTSEAGSEPASNVTASLSDTLLARELGLKPDDQFEGVGSEAVTESMLKALSADESALPSSHNPPKADTSGLPGPASFNEGATFAPEFIEVEDDSLAGDLSLEDDGSGPIAPFGGAPAMSEAAQVALARLSAAVEMEKAEMAANPGVWSPSEFEQPESDLFEEDEPLEPLPEPSFSQPSQRASINARSPEASFSRARKMYSADSTVMVQMYEDVADFAPADGTATPLSADEEMEIGLLDDELSIEPIDMDHLDDLDLDYSQMPGKSKERSSLPKAKHLSTVVPGNTIIPK